MVSAAMVQGVVSKPECEIGFSGVIELVKEFRDEVKEQESLHLWMNLELIKTLACYAPLLCGFSLFLLPCVCLFLNFLTFSLFFVKSKCLGLIKKQVFNALSCLKFPLCFCKRFELFWRFWCCEVCS